MQGFAQQSNAHVVFGSEVEGKVLVAAFARKGELQRLGRSPDGCSHRFTWKLGHQCIRVRNAYLQGWTQEEKDNLEHVLEKWLEQAEGEGEPSLIVGDFNTTCDEVCATRWFEAAGLYELGGQLQPATCLPGRGRPRRIDWIWANRAAQPVLCGDAAVCWDLGLRPHTAQALKVELQDARRFPKWAPGGATSAVACLVGHR